LCANYAFFGASDFNRNRGSIYMVFEWMDHDLAGVNTFFMSSLIAMLLGFYTIPLNLNELYILYKKLSLFKSFPPQNLFII
jgi:hypothetical protein